MKEECAWCGEVKEVYGWKESIDQDKKGNEIHAPICKDCFLTYFENGQSLGESQT